MKKNPNDCCPDRNQSINNNKAQYQILMEQPSTGDLTILPNGNTVNLCEVVKYCETLTQISTLRLVSDSILEIVYIGEDLIPVSKTVDLSALATNPGTAITVGDTNTIDLELDVNDNLTAILKLDPSSTAPVTATANGLKIDCCAQTPISISNSDTVVLSSTGTLGHTLSGAVRFADTSTVTLATSASGLVAAVKLSNSPNQLISIDGTGLLVDQSEIEALIGDAQGINADSPLLYDSGTNTISIAQSNALADGYLSSTDWIDFDQKVDPSRTISTLGPLNGGGDLSANRTFSITQGGASTDGYITAVDWNIFNSKLNSSRLINTTAPLTGGGSLAGDLTLAITQASVSTSGFLSNVNFAIFNSKPDTAVNVGSGANIFKQKTPPNLEFRSLTGTPGQIVLTQNADTVNIGIDPGFSSGGGGGTDLIIKDEGTNITTAAVSINFAGAGVTATQTSGDVTVTIPGQVNTIANVSYVDGTYGANIADADKVVFLKATTANLVYNISPVTFSGRKIIIYCNQTGSFTVTINATSGSIGLTTSYVAADHECITVYSDGTNLYAIAKN